MAEVKILLEGFTNSDSRKEGEDEKTRCTSTLIIEEHAALNLTGGDRLVILTDPGVLDDQKIMEDALLENGLLIDDITHIFLTHNHPDHHRNVGMFPGAKMIEYFGLWDGAKCYDRPEKMSENIEIIETPGHSYDGLTMLVETEKGKVAIAGDLWWSKRGPENDPYASDADKLKRSRAEVLKLADYIIPGHGGIFKVREE